MIMKLNVFSIPLHRAIVGAFVVALGFAATSRAQIGSGWSHYSPSYYVQHGGSGSIDDFPPASHYSWPGASYDNAGGVETFRLTSTASNRVEFRSRETYSSGQRQFQGEVRVSSPTGDESVFQIFHIMLLRALSGNGGHFEWHLHGQPTKSIGSNLYGKWIRVNVVHDANANKITLYVNGVSAGTLTSPDETVYFKYGVYGTLQSSSAKVEWRNVSFFKK
jgi:hypothetical protein